MDYLLKEQTLDFNFKFWGKTVTNNRSSISESLIESAIRVLFRGVFVFEPLAPTAITLLVNQQLRRFRDAGAIEKYKSRTKRLGKFHYKIEIDLDLTGRQALHLLSNLFPKQLNRLGGGSMTEMAEKKGKLKITVEVEVNEELLDLAKDAMAKMPMRMQEMWKGHGGEKKE